jgi:hypothetical protein
MGLMATKECEGNTGGARLWTNDQRGRGVTGAEGKADDKHSLALREEVKVQQDEDVRVVAEVEQEVVVLLASARRKISGSVVRVKMWPNGEAGLIRT